MKNNEDKICTAALRLAAKQGWATVTLDTIAKVAKIPSAQLKKQFAGKNLILPALVRHITARASAKKPDLRAPPHDRLFEIMMARFDALQEHRAGILSILDACRREPVVVRLILPAQLEAMQKMIALARLDTVPLANFGLLTVYYRGLWIWQNDSTKDMAKTMAALDQALRCMEKLAGILSNSSKLF